MKTKTLIVFPNKDQQYKRNKYKHFHPHEGYLIEVPRRYTKSQVAEYMASADFVKHATPLSNVVSAAEMYWSMREE